MGQSLLQNGLFQRGKVNGTSEAIFYKYKAKFGGMEISDARKLNALEDENAKLKKLRAETMLGNAILKDVASKNVWSAPSLRGFATSQMTIPVA